MTKNLQYLLWFANEHVNFRLPEVLSVVKLLNIDMRWVSKPSLEPFWVVEFLSESDASRLASRCISLKCVLQLWAQGSTVEELHEKLQSYPTHSLARHFQPDLSFRVLVETFGRTFTMKEKVDKIEMFSYLPVTGPVKLTLPDVTLHYIEYYGLQPANTSHQPLTCYFGKWMCDGPRDLISKYSLKQRKFIGNTSMDPQLAFLMANQALVEPGHLVLDPFVGTGSLLVAAACFGAYVMGADIDFLMLHGRSRPTRIQHRARPRGTDESVYENLKQYKTEHLYVDVVVGDSSLPFWHQRLQLDSIITDPPYGIREAAERIGSVKGNKVAEEHLPSHIPSKVDYGLHLMFHDLLEFAAKHIRVGGRLVSWMPVNRADYSHDLVPAHQHFTLVANSEQVLSSQTSRRLLTWEKLSEPLLSAPPHLSSNMFPPRFREHYFGSGETRRERRRRVAEELQQRGIKYVPRDRR